VIRKNQEHSHYEGIEPPIDYGLFTEKGIEWLHSLALEPVESYLQIIKPPDDEIKHISGHLKELAEDDTDVKFLITISGVEYYTMLLVKSDIEDIKRFSDGDKLYGYARLVRQHMLAEAQSDMEASLKTEADGCDGLWLKPL
jgi:hypothetical protein